MKRKLFALLLAALLALGTALCFAGCGSNNGSASTPSDPSTPSSPSSPSSPSDTDPDDKTKPETPEEPDEKKDETPENPEEPKENPDDTPSDPPMEEFSLAENREKIIENVMPVLKYYAKCAFGSDSQIERVYDLYFHTNTSTTTLGAILTIIRGTTIFLQCEEINFPLQTNLSFNYLSTTSITYDKSNIKFNKIYTFNISINDSVKYATTIEKIQRKVFENYDDALWLGWTGVSGPQYDDHQIVCYDGKQIKETWITITNDHNTLPFPSGAVDKYFVNDQYKRYDNYGTTITLPEDTLSALIEKELREAEQE